MDKRKISKYWRRMGAETGVAFYYTVIISFFILALLTMIFDVSVVSQKKMQAQNAADSAALEMAVWQCRGMNLVQNINTDIYQTDTVLCVLYGVAGAMTGVGMILEEVPFLEEVGVAIEAAASVIARVAYYVHKYIVDIFLKNLRTFYADGSLLMGYIAANNIAEANGAESIIPKIPSGGGGSGSIIDKLISMVTDVINKMDSGFVALGIPTSPKAAYKIPVDIDEKKTENIPINISMKDPPTSHAGSAYMVLMALLMENEFLEDLEEDLLWDDKPYRSDEDMLKVPPMIWVVYKKNDVGYISRYFLGGTDSDYKNPPILAYAVGQAQGGNVTMTSSPDHPFRPLLYGAGMDAFLISIDNIRIPDIEGGGIKIHFNIVEYFDKFFLH